MKNHIKNYWLLCITSTLCSCLVVTGLWGTAWVVGCTTAPCNAIRTLEWESITAGLLGLSAGVFVIISTRKQIAALRETTAETVRQARLHRADEACAPLILSHEVTDKFRFWAIEKIAFLEEIKAQYESGFSDAKIASLAIDRANRDLARRCDHVKKILDTHSTTTFNYEVSAALELLSESANFTDASTPTFVVSSDIARRLQVIFGKLAQARSCSVSARGMIDAQIEAIRDRCGVKV